MLTSSTEKEVASTVESAFRGREVLKDLAAHEDFFQRGVSSLTVVELQITIESQLKVTVPTSKLMISPTLSEWTEIYTDALRELLSAPARSATA